MDGFSYDYDIIKYLCNIIVLYFYTITLTALGVVKC